MKKANIKKDRRTLPKEVPVSPRGMRDIIGEDLYAYQGFFEKCSEIATYYGFKPIETPILENTEIFLRGIGEGTDIVDKEMYHIKTKSDSQLSMRPENTAGIMRAYIEHGMQTWPQPVMLYYFGPYFRHDKPQRGRFRELHQFGLEILGSSKSIADAMIIKLTAVMLEEAGFKNLSVQINSIGDKECRGAYKKELASYYRKNEDSLCKDCKIRIKINPLRLLDCKEEKCHPIKENAPQAISYLCPPCKTHFKEVLEYLEVMQIEYTINNNLVRGLDYYSRTVFEIFSKNKTEAPATSTNENKNLSADDGVSVKSLPEEPEEKEKTPEITPITTNLSLAGGGRYDYLARTMGHRKDIPGVGMSIGADRVVMSPEYAKLVPRIIKKPKIYFIQLGFDAKLQSMAIIEILRKNKIPVVHALGRDRLSVQLAIAEKIQVPFAIILGQREVIDKTVIIRNMETHSQEMVKIGKLSEHIKKIIK